MYDKYSLSDKNQASCRFEIEGINVSPYSVKETVRNSPDTVQKYVNSSLLSDIEFTNIEVDLSRDLQEDLFGTISMDDLFDENVNVACPGLNSTAAAAASGIATEAGSSSTDSAPGLQVEAWLESFCNVYLREGFEGSDSVATACDSGVMGVQPGAALQSTSMPDLVLGTVGTIPSAHEDTNIGLSTVDAPIVIQGSLEDILSCKYIPDGAIYVDSEGIASSPDVLWSDAGSHEIKAEQDCDLLEREDEVDEALCSNTRSQGVAPPPSSGRKRLASSMTSQGSDSESEDSAGEEGSDSESDDDSRLDNKQGFAQDFLSHGCKTPPYFWQYNAQNRGPKGKRLIAALELKNPHVLDDFVDPVDGDSKPRGDPRPNPDKLFDIGRRIRNLEEEFRSLQSKPGALSKADVNKQKNKLASRICRLKRKGQHEANKLKLAGLRDEHNQLKTVITSQRKEIIAQLNAKKNPWSVSVPPQMHIKVERPLMSASALQASAENSLNSEAVVPNVYLTTGKTSLSANISALIRQHLKFMIAGHTEEYVNSEMKKIGRIILKRQSLPPDPGA